jgi:hypothetical protein
MQDVEVETDNLLKVKGLEEYGSFKFSVKGSRHNSFWIRKI